MTVAEAVDLFELLLDKVDSDSLPEIETVEIETFLSLAQNEFVRTWYKKLETSEFVRQALSPTISESSTALPTISGGRYIFSNGDIHVANSNIYAILREELNYTDTLCNKKITRYPRVVTQDTINKIKRNPFRRPSLKKPIRYNIGDNVYLDFGQEVDTVRYTPFTYDVTIISLPPEVEVGAQQFTVSDVAHEDIVNLAVRKALENVEAPRYQSHSIETKLTNT